MTWWHRTWRDAGVKQRALAICSALAAALFAVAGVAMILRWTPFVDAFALWGAPAWLVPLAGATALGVGLLLLIEDAAFAAALAATIGAFAMALGYAGNGDFALAALPALAGALAAAVMVMRHDAPLVRRRGRARSSTSATAHA